MSSKDWTDDPDRKPWDPDPQWSPERVQAFQEYRDFGASRNLRAVAQRLSKSQQLMRRWSMEDRWVARCAQYDAYLDSLRRAEREAQIKEVTRRHAETLSTTWEVLAAPAMELARRIRELEQGIDLSEAKTSDLIAAAASAAQVLPKLVQAERLVLGMTTELVGIDGASDKTLDEADDYLVGMSTGDEALADADVEEPLALSSGDAVGE